MKQHVIFLCAENSVRSQMAEAFLRKHASDRYEAFSAGVDPEEIHPFAIQVMQEAGIVISGQFSKSVALFLGKVHFDYVITVCDKAKKNCPARWPAVIKQLHWSFDDPTKSEGTNAEKLEKFRSVRDQIERKVIDWLGL